MKYLDRVVLSVVALSALGLTQTHFRWSARKAQELSYDQTIAKSTELTSADRESLLKAIAAQIRPFKKDLEISSEHELRAIAAKTRIKLVDLNGDGTPEVLAQGNNLKAGCGATGNCPFWVFEKTPSGFLKLLDTRNKDGNGGIQLFTISESKSNGFNDLVLATHDSASERSLYVYRFRSGKYQQAECYVASWVSTEHGKWRELKNPEIGPCPND